MIDSRKLPSSEVAEKAVVSCVLLDKHGLEKVKDILNDHNYFYEHTYSVVWKAILELSRKNEPVDLITVVEQLKKNGHLEKAGGAYGVSALTNNVSSAANIVSYANTIIDNHMRRQFIELTYKYNEMAFDMGQDVTAIMDECETTVASMYDNVTADDIMPASFAIKEIKESSMKILERGDKLVTGIPTPYTYLNKTTSGWQDGDLIIIAGRPSHGKTITAIDSVRAAIKAGHRPAFFSLEMNALKVASRLTGPDLMIDTNDLIKRRVSTDQFNEFMDRFESTYANNFLFDYSPGLKDTSFRAKVRKAVKNYGVDLVIVDYLQLMSTASKVGTREQEISEISRTLKKIAEENKIPVIALSQLSRSIESRTGADKRPRLSDLRESGSIEQDADMVIFCFQPHKWGINEVYMGIPGVDKTPVPSEGIVFFDIAKNRDGALDTIKVSSKDVKYGSFKDIMYDPVNGGSKVTDIFRQHGNGYENPF